MNNEGRTRSPLSDDGKWWIGQTDPFAEDEPGANDDDVPWTCGKCGYVEVGPKPCGQCGTTPGRVSSDHQSRDERGQRVPCPCGHGFDQHYQPFGEAEGCLSCEKGQVPSPPRQGDPCGACGHSTFFPRWSPALLLWLCLPCQDAEDNSKKGKNDG